MITTRNLKWIGIVLPIFFLGAVLTVRARFGADQSAWYAEIFLFALIVIGIIAFSTWIFGVIGQREQEIQARTDQLRALHEAALALTTELDLAAVLQKVIDLARELVLAKYGALGVLDVEGSYIEQFVTSGLPAGENERLGPPPHGLGILGVLIKEGTSLRLADISSDWRSHGFPDNHPRMTTFLGVPIQSKGKVIGNLYLVDKLNPGQREGPPLEFTERDQQILEMFATQAAIAIENAQLYRQTQQLAILEERERFGMDLHDGIIQSIYAIGLMLEDAQHRLETDTGQEQPGLTRAVHGLNEVIRDIRNYILDLRPQRFQGRDLTRGVEELARELKANSFLDVQLDADGFDQTGIPPETTVELLHIVQEALTNIRKHARASNVRIRLGHQNGDIQLVIEDNGIGIDLEAAERSLGNGLHNMQERARNMAGSIQFKARPEGGTRIRLKVPQK